MCDSLRFTNLCCILVVSYYIPSPALRLGLVVSICYVVTTDTQVLTVYTTVLSFCASFVCLLSSHSVLLQQCHRIIYCIVNLNRGRYGVLIEEVREGR
jgi:hypothetical protein